MNCTASAIGSVDWCGLVAFPPSPQTTTFSYSWSHFRNGVLNVGNPATLAQS
jgi:hypothetical protein